jgi:hypothetical protein
MNWNVLKERGRGLIRGSVTKFAWTGSGKPQQSSLRFFRVAAYILTAISAYTSQKGYHLFVLLYDNVTVVIVLQLQRIQITENQFLGFLQIISLQERVKSHKMCLE